MGAFLLVFVGGLLAAWLWKLVKTKERPLKEVALPFLIAFALGAVVATLFQSNPHLMSKRQCMWEASKRPTNAGIYRALEACGVE